MDLAGGPLPFGSDVPDPSATTQRSASNLRRRVRSNRASLVQLEGDPACLAAQLLLRLQRVPFDVENWNTLMASQLAGVDDDAVSSAALSQQQQLPLVVLRGIAGAKIGEERACCGWEALVCALNEIEGEAALSTEADSEPVAAAAAAPTRGTSLVSPAESLSIDAWMSPLDQADAAAYKTLILQRLAPAFVFQRWVVEENGRAMSKHIARTAAPRPLAFPTSRWVPFWFRRRMLEQLSGYRGLTAEGTLQDAAEVAAFLDTRLGNRAFFFGDNRPSSLDCLVFGYLGAIVLFPQPRDELREIIVGHPNLVRFVNAIKDVFFRTPLYDTRGLPVFPATESSPDSTAQSLSRRSKGNFDRTVVSPGKAPADDDDADAADAPDMQESGGRNSMGNMGAAPVFPADAVNDSGNTGYVPPPPRFRADVPQPAPEPTRRPMVDPVAVANVATSVLFVLGAAGAMFAYVHSRSKFVDGDIDVTGFPWTWKSSR